MKKLLTGEWFIDRTSARHRRILHYWATIVWLTVGSAAWIILRDALWFVGFMSLYAIWITHIAGWAAETPVEAEEDGGGGTARAYGRATRPSALRTPVSGAAVQAAMALDLYLKAATVGQMFDENGSREDGAPQRRWIVMERAWLEPATPSLQSVGGRLRLATTVRVQRVPAYAEASRLRSVRAPVDIVLT